jgi:uncharacterized tellurite resistance protein B-like protein
MLTLLHKLKSFLLGVNEESETASLLFDKMGEPTDESLRLAAITILLAAASCDKEILLIELTELQEEVRRELGISKEESKQYTDKALSQIKDSERLAAICKTLVKRLDEKQRSELFKIVWRIALADGFISADEERFSTWLATALEMPS